MSEHERPEKMPPLEPPVVWPEGGIESPVQASNRVLEPDDIQREPFAGINRGIAALIAKEKDAGEQRSFVYPSKVWEYPWALTRHPLPKGELVLDAGCGVSTMPLYLASEGATVVALDNDVRWLSLERVAAQFHGLPVVPVLGNIEGLGFPDDTFDRVYCISVLEHIDVARQPKAIREMARVLRPGGVLYLTVDYDQEERRSGDDVVYDRLALQRNAIGPSGLEIEGSTHYGCDDWDRQHQRMREFKLHTFGAMAVVLRKPPTEGPESGEAIDARRTSFEEFSELHEVKDLASAPPAGDLYVAVADAEELLRVDAQVHDAGRRWVAQPSTPDGLPAALAEAKALRGVELPSCAHEAMTGLVRECHAAAPKLPVMAFASVDAVIDGAFDGTGLDVYGVEVAGAVIGAPTVSLVRSCIARGIGAKEARAAGYCAAVLRR